jgi:hypothetical protein
MRDFARLRRLALLRRANRELFDDLRSWPWWRYHLATKLVPFLLVGFAFWAIGFFNGVGYMGKEIDARFTCVERPHAN